MNFEAVRDDATKTLYKQLPRIKRSEIRMLWHTSYWDGPLAGHVLYQGKQYWFNCVFEAENRRRTRHFVLVELTPEQLEEEHDWHRLFQEKVGTHTDYDESGQRAIGAVKAQGTWAEFYEPARQRPQMDVSDRPVVGWWAD